METKKTRRLAKDLAKMPRFKKKIAEWLTLHDGKRLDAMQVKLTGHRGYLSMSEKELTDNFDSVVEGLVKLLESQQKELAEAIADRESTYEINRIKRYIEETESTLKTSEDIVNEIMEELVLKS